MLNHDDLIPDISDINRAFYNGCLSDDIRVQEDCSSAISFLVTHRLVYKSYFTPEMSEEQKDEILEQIKNSPIDHILDAIMYLSGSDSILIRTIAFSTLSSLSKFSSECKSVLAQIQRDITLPDDLNSKNHFDFITKRLKENKAKFAERIKNEELEK